MEKELKTKISEILVKWNMPTRQTAINEIVALQEQAIQATREETVNEIEKHLNSISKYNDQGEFYYNLRQLRIFLSKLVPQSAQKKGIRR